ncbi:hypothetical protein [Kinneretia aquatilis]|uniref:hypothetical protein n=1 Tax=Kinneretia aquatilis TaxID=2070761 RepID=UPI00149519D6|nr:hypothetical protein [Paucibacter aquatile]WIV98451.1 hypothetical protein K9V56_002765 [Paucibacter aquatile]
MTEPGRKKEKGRDQGEVACGEPNEGERAFSFWSVHPELPTFVDLSPFACGQERSSTGRCWKGDFTGRPELLVDILPILREELSILAPRSIEWTLASLRAWWRVFDEAERADSNKEQPRVCRVEDITELHQLVSRRMNMTVATHTAFVRIVNLRLFQKNRPPLYWRLPTKSPLKSEAPTAHEIQRIRLALKRRWFAAIDRWAAADLWPTDLTRAKLPKPKRAEHVHSIYRGVVQTAGRALPTGAQAAVVLGLKECPRWLPLGEGISGLYPTGDDVRAAFHLCLLISGWNVSSLLDLVASDDLVERHPTSDDYHLVRSRKRRGNSEQLVVGRDRRSDSVGSILRTLMSRSAPLRAQLADEASKLMDGANGIPSMERRLELNRLRKMSSSPWLFANFKANTIMCLTQQNLYKVGKSGMYLQELIRQINCANAVGAVKVRDTITAGDFRDAYIGFAYEFSNYSLLTAQSAAGHKSVRTTQTYLRHRAWKEHSSKVVRRLTEAAWDEIETQRSLDPAVLRERIRCGEISVQQRLALHEHRASTTRVGVRCRDFRNPPAAVDPDHVDGGGCRTQRCTLCPHAIVSTDSFDLLARRQAELEWVRENIPVQSWSRANFEDELTNASLLLGMFDTEQVNSCLQKWRAAIQAGAHRVMHFDGQHS